MNRSRSQLDAYQLRHSSLRKPGYLPQASRRISPITSNGHKYELKQKTWPKQTVESWFENHSPEECRTVYNFLNTLYISEDDRAPIIKQPERRPERTSHTRLPMRIKSSAAVASPPSPASPFLQRQPSNQSGRVSRASKRDLGEILESLESLSHYYEERLSNEESVEEFFAPTNKEKKQIGRRKCSVEKFMTTNRDFGEKKIRIWMKLTLEIDVEEVVIKDSLQSETFSSEEKKKNIHLRPSLLVQDKSIQTVATPITVPLPHVTTTKTESTVENHLKRPTSSMDKHIEVVQPTTSINPSTNENQEENTKVSRRYLSHTWRVINPREDMEPNVRPENNSSSFFQYTKKVYPEYFFIHPDWY